MKKYINYYFIIFFLFISLKVNCDTALKNKAINYLGSLKNFSSSFIQNDGENLSEGSVYIGEKRVRAEYLYPTKILIILDQNKAMYYNYDLEEDEFFNPKDTSAWFFYDIFRNPNFFKDSKITLDENSIILEKKGIDSEETDYLIKVFFENNPLILRKIEVNVNEEYLQISIFNHNYNRDFKANFFKLINPSLLN